MAAFVIQQGAALVTAQNPVITFPLGTSDNSLLVIFFSWANTSGAVSSVTDTAGNIWQTISFQQQSGNLRTIYCFAVQNDDGGPTTVTVATDSSRTYSYSFFEVAGASLNLDGSPININSGTNQTTSPATGSLTTQVPGSIVFAHTKCGAIVTDPPGPPWNENDTNNASTVYQITTVSGSFSATWVAAASFWATTILAFQPQPGPNIVLGPYPIISDLPVSVNQLADPSVLVSSIVGMVSYRVQWKTIQPTKPTTLTNNPSDPSFNWTLLDQMVAQAKFYKKLISIHLTAQDGGQPGWVKNNSLQYIDTTGDSIAMYGDPYYQSHYIALIQAIGTRYPNTFYKFSGGIASTGGSWNVPHTSTDIAALLAPPYNYTTATIVSAQNAITDAVVAALPGTYIQLQVGTSGSLDISPGGPTKRYNAATQMSQYGYSHYLTRYAMDRDGFDPFTPLPQQALASQDQSGWFLLAQPTVGSVNTSGTTGTIPQGGTVFGQANWPAIDPSGQYTAASTNNYKANGGVPYSSSNVANVVNQTIVLARAYFCQVFEVYEQDIKGVLIPATRPPWGVGFIGSRTAIISPTSDIINPGFNI